MSGSAIRSSNFICKEVNIWVKILHSSCQSDTKQTIGNSWNSVKANGVWDEEMYGGHFNDNLPWEGEDVTENSTADAIEITLQISMSNF